MAPPDTIQGAQQDKAGGQELEDQSLDAMFPDLGERPEMKRREEETENRLKQS